MDLRTLAEDAWENVQTEDATLEIVGTMSFQASRRALLHVLENLFETALTHVGEDVTVAIGGQEGGLYVEDDGPGIPEEYRNEIFQRGYFVESDSSGLGHQVLNRIALNHN